MKNTFNPIWAIFLLLALWFHQTSLLFSQNHYATYGYRFQQYHVKEGLPFLDYAQFFQDSRGLNWIATSENVVCYDGHTFTLFEGEGTIWEDFEKVKVRGFLEDRWGYIWMETLGYGVFRYRPETQQLKRFFLTENGWNEPLISSITEDASGAIGFATSKGFYRLLFPENDREAKPIVQSYLPVPFPKSLYDLTDTLSHQGQGLAAKFSMLLETDMPTSFELKDSMWVFVLGMGFRKAGMPYGFDNWVGIENEKGDSVWQMTLPETYDAADFGASRVQAAVLVLPQGTYQLGFEYVPSNNLQIPTHLFPYHGLQVFLIEETTAKIIQKTLAAQPPENSMLEQVNTILFTDADGVTWIGGNMGLTKMTIPDLQQPERVIFKHYQSLPNVPTSLETSHVHIIQPRKVGGLWIMGNTHFSETGAWGKPILEHFDPDTEVAMTYQHGMIDEYIFTSFQEMEDGSLWWGVYSGTSNEANGMYHLRLPLVPKGATGMPNLQHLTFDPSGLFFKKSGITFIEKGFSGSWWLGEMNEGLFQLNPQTNRFGHYTLPSNGLAGAVNPRCFLKDSEGKLWIGTQGHGVYQYDFETFSAKHFHHKPSNVTSLSNNFVIALEMDKKGQIWVATLNGVLHQFQPTTGLFQHFPVPNDPHESHPEHEKKVIFDLAFDPENGLWISTNSGLFLFDPQTQRYVKHLFHLNDTYSAWEWRAEKLCFEKPNELWVSFFGKGLYKLVLVRDKGKETYKLETSKINQHLIRQISVKDGIVWVGTEEGLIHWEISTDSLRLFSKKNLMTQELQSVLVDEQGWAWITDESSLTHFNPITNDLRTFDSEDGLIPPFIRNGKHLLAWGDSLIYSSNGGFHLFAPKDLQANPVPPKVHLTQFFISNKAVPVGDSFLLKKTLAFPQHLVLKATENDLTFHYIGLHYQNPSKNQYRYQLIGYDKTWIEAGTNRVATYTNLPAGDYIFQVQAANSNGVWSLPNANFSFQILYPWWATWWAIVLLIILLGSIAWAIYRFQLNRRLERAEKDRLVVLHESHQRFYTNITHEFRTPLTIILGLTEVLKNEVTDKMQINLERIQRNGQQLLQLVNQLLDLSKMESGLLTLNFENGDVIAYLRYLTESFHTLAKDKGIELEFQSDLEECFIEFDAERLRQVMFNLLSNAIKFTEKGGIVCSVERQLLNFEKLGTVPCLTIKLKDTGIGISSDHLLRIFDRFYQIDASHSQAGTGIGLPLVKKLVALMGGEISVESSLGEGTRFSVVLPIKMVEAHSSKPEPSQVHSLPIETTTLATDIPEPKISNRQSAIEILLIEDNPDVLYYLRLCLGSDYQITTAKNGEVGIQKAFERLPQLIISDVMMPKKDGFEVCQTLKTSEQTSHIPIILLTAKADLNSKLTGLKQGADAYLAKPFEKAELQIRVRKLLEMRQRLQKYYQAIAGLTDEVIKPIESNPIDHEFVRKICQVIEENLGNEQFGVPELGQAVMMSRSQLYRKLMDLTGKSPSQWINSVRLKKAKTLLEEPDLSITDIAFELGFNDSNYFSKVFKKEFGETPSKWRKNLS